MNRVEAKTVGLAAVYRMGPAMRPGIRLSEMDLSVIYVPYIPLYKAQHVLGRREDFIARLAARRAERKRNRDKTDC